MQITTQQVGTVIVRRTELPVSAENLQTIVSRPAGISASDSATVTVSPPHLVVVVVVMSDSSCTLALLELVESHVLVRLEADHGHQQ